MPPPILFPGGFWYNDLIIWTAVSCRMEVIMDIYAKLTEDLQKVCPALEIRENEPMARHTTFRIGGPARLIDVYKRQTAGATIRLLPGPSGICTNITPS